MPNSKILFISGINHKMYSPDYWEGLQDETKRTLGLTTLPKVMPPDKADLALMEIDKNHLDAVVLFTLLLRGEKDKRLKRVCEIPEVTIKGDINYHQGLPLSNMPGVAFMYHLKEAEINFGLVSDVHPDVERFLYNELEIGFVYSRITGREVIIHALGNMLHPPRR